jgi:hypothetical protein
MKTNMRVVVAAVFATLLGIAQQASAACFWHPLGEYATGGSQNAVCFTDETGTSGSIAAGQFQTKNGWTGATNTFDQLTVDGCNNRSTYVNFYWEIEWVSAFSGGLRRITGYAGETKCGWFAQHQFNARSNEVLWQMRCSVATGC